MIQLLPPPKELYCFSGIVGISDYKAITEFRDSLKSYNSQLKGDDRIKWRYFIPFGEMDLIVEIEGFVDKQLLLPFKKSHRSNFLRLFHVNSNIEYRTKQSPLHALVFLKLNEDNGQKQNISILNNKIIPQLNCFLENSKLNVDINFYVSLGWFEIIICVNFDNIIDLAKLLLFFRSVTIGYSNKKSKNNNAIISGSSSIVSIRSDLKGKGVVPSSNIPNIVIDSNIRLNCKSGFNTSTVLKHVKDHFNRSPEFVFGSNDLNVSYKNIQIGSLFEKVIAIRKNLNKEINITNTTISLPSKKLNSIMKSM